MTRKQKQGTFGLLATAGDETDAGEVAKLQSKRAQRRLAQSRSAASDEEDCAEMQQVLLLSLQEQTAATGAAASCMTLAARVQCGTSAQAASLSADHCLLGDVTHAAGARTAANFQSNQRQPPCDAAQEEWPAVGNPVSVSPHWSLTNMSPLKCTSVAAPSSQATGAAQQQPSFPKGRKGKHAAKLSPAAAQELADIQHALSLSLAESSRYQPPEDDEWAFGSDGGSVGAGSGCSGSTQQAGGAHTPASSTSTAARIDTARLAAEQQRPPPSPPQQTWQWEPAEPTHASPSAHGFWMQAASGLRARLQREEAEWAASWQEQLWSASATATTSATAKSTSNSQAASVVDSNSLARWGRGNAAGAQPSARASDHNGGGWATSTAGSECALAFPALLPAPWCTSEAPDTRLVSVWDAGPSALCASGSGGSKSTSTSKNTCGGFNADKPSPVVSAHTKHGQVHKAAAAGSKSAAVKKAPARPGVKVLNVGYNNTSLPANGVIKVTSQLNGFDANSWASYSHNYSHSPSSRSQLEWELEVEGLQPLQDPLAVAPSRYLDAQCNTHKAAVLALHEQQAAAVAAGNGSVQGVDIERMLAMQQQVAKRHAAALRLRSIEEEDEMLWDLFNSLVSQCEFEAQVRALRKGQGGWVLVKDTKGSHPKYRRLLLDGTKQTCSHPSSPSDSQRGVENQRADLKRFDQLAFEANKAFMARERAAAAAMAEVAAAALAKQQTDTPN